MAEERFEKAEQEFLRLKGQLAAGRITLEQFDAALKELIVEDAQGRFWMLGADSGKWYVHDGQSWVEATPPGMTEPVTTAAALPRPLVPQPQSPQPQPKKSRKLPAIIATVGGGLLTLLVGLAVTWGQGFVRTALLGGAATATQTVSGAGNLASGSLIQTATATHTPTPTSTLTLTTTPEVPTPLVIVITATPPPSSNVPPPVNPPPPVIIVITATPLPRTNTSTRTNTPPPTRSSTPTITPSPMPTFPSSVITWSKGFDQSAGKPVNVVSNKTFTPPPTEIYATWNPTGIPSGTKLQNTWYYAGNVWAQGEYVLKQGDTYLWYSTFRTDRQPLSPGTYRFEIKVNAQVILTDQVVVQ